MASPAPSADDLSLLQQRLGYTFRDRTLLERALTHTSLLPERPDLPESNQRLEFLGDAVLQLVLTEALFTLYPGEREGRLSKRRAVLTNGAFLAAMARESGLDRCLLMSTSEEASGGRSRPSALGDAFEAILGAIHAESGFEAARRTILALYGPLEARLTGALEDDNPKGRLQELVQPRHGNSAVIYEVIRTEGLDHNRRFEVAVRIVDRLVGMGRGPSKKSAEEAAARDALETLRQDAPG